MEQPVEKENVIHLLVLSESSHDAEVLASTLRNNGYAVRLKHIEDEEDLNTSIRESNWELLITSHQVADFTGFQALTVINNLGKDLPCIIHGEKLDRPTIIEYLRAGAADCISADEQDHLLIVIKRELGNLQTRRSYRECKSGLIESEKRNKTLLDSSRDAIAYIHEGMHIYANLSYQELFAYDDSEELECTPIMDLVSPDNQKDFKDVIRKLSNGETPDHEFEFDGIRNSGETFEAKMEFSPASIEGEPCTQIVIHQQNDNAQLEQELEKLRRQDLLTGLYNHNYLLELLTGCISSAANGKDISVLIYIEPDNINTIRDTLGIAGVDIVISDIANILRETISSDIVARYSDTIFTAIIPNKTTDEIEDTVADILTNFEEHIFDVDGKTVATTCSIGVTPITEKTPDAKTALSFAEAACAMAKSQGGNHIHIHTIADEAASLEVDRAWADKLKTALKENLFMLHFQPIVSLHAEPGERYESFIRLQDSEQNIIMPAEFMEAARSSQLMTDIDRWVLKSAAKALLEKRREVAEVSFFVKISTESIHDPSLLPWISKLLKAARLHGSALVFELSEADVVNSLKTTKAFSNGLKQLHCGLAIDHVGSANAKFSYLQHLNVNYLKISGEIISNLTSSESSQELVKEVTDIAKQKGIQTIAQHVQDPACLAALWQYGINFIQGHYLQMPEKSLNYDFSSEN